jgi:hypothetical protein
MLLAAAAHHMVMQGTLLVYQVASETRTAAMACSQSREQLRMTGCLNQLPAAVPGACSCVIVRDGQVIGSGFNMTNHTRNVS